MIMAKSEILMPFILSWEGGYGNHPQDKGGPTNKGVTLDTFRSFYGKERTIEDLKKITDEQWLHIFKTGFWDRWRADEIENQSLANLVVDWVYNSGKWGITKVQKILGVKVDGVVGPKTLAALNAQDPQLLFRKIHSAREIFIRGLSNFAVFGRGLLNRNDAIGFGWLKYGGKIVRC